MGYRNILNNLELSENQIPLCKQCIKNVAIYLNNRYVSKDCCHNDSTIRNNLSNFQPFQITAKPKIRRPASTVINKNYNTSNSQYLKSRVKTFDQNQTLSIIPGNNAIDLEFQNPELPPATNNFVYPINNIDQGSQAYNSTNCCDQVILGPVEGNKPPIVLNENNAHKSKRVVWKKSNPFYSNQGAVSQGQIIHNRNVNTINKNFKDFRTEMVPYYDGKPITNPNTNENLHLRGSTPSGYKGVNETYFIKNKYQQVSSCKIRNRTTLPCN